MSPQELKRIAATCADLGNQAADESGFVALHRLAALLRAEIEFRPLLVEAVIAAPTGPGTWKVLVDSETHPDGAKAFPVESPQAPLSARLRNTLAHELLHTLSFRAEEFGFRLELNVKETRAEAVKRLERETEGFSPFLVLPQKTIETELEARELSLDVLVDWRRRWVVSREVLVARLGLFQSLPEFRLRYHANVTNVAVCLAEWMNEESAVLLEWPVHFNFRDGIVPEFIWQLRNKGKPQLRELFPGSEFLLNGGSKLITRSTLPAGTGANPRADKLHVVAEIEPVQKKKSETFLIVFCAE
jgi:hypothetical protein